MPYIKKENRVKLEEPARNIAVNIACAGDLNFVFTEIIDEYIKRRGCKYTTLNEVVGAIECCKIELYRRIAGPYEDKKIIENGDVFSKELL